MSEDNSVLEALAACNTPPQGSIPAAQHLLMPMADNASARILQTSETSPDAREHQVQHSQEDERPSKVLKSGDPISADVRELTAVLQNHALLMSQCLQTFMNSAMHMNAVSQCEQAAVETITHL